jgi:hypothetical protein
MAGREKRKRRRKQRIAGGGRSVGAPEPAAASPNGSAGDQERGALEDPVRAQAPRRKSKDDLAREQLVPLREGERPLAVTIAAIVAALLALANLVLSVAGVEVEDAQSNAGGAILFAILMGVAAVGMWFARYWAVLGFQAILALSIVSLVLFLFVGANNVLSALVATVLTVAAGALFWFLVKALARIQMPERRPPP